MQLWHGALRGRAPVAAMILVLAPAALAVPPGDPTQAPIPVFDADLDAKSFRVVVDFASRESAGMASAEVRESLARSRVGNPPLLRVRVLDRDGSTIQSFDEWHPLWDFVHDADGSESLVVQETGEGELVFPFQREAAEIRVADMALGEEVLQGDLTGAVAAFCLDDPTDAACDQSDLAVLAVRPVSPPPFVLLGQPVDLQVETEFTNEGPDGPVEALLVKRVVAPPQVDVQPVAQEQVETDLAVGELRVDVATYQVACLAAGRHVVRFRSEVAPNLPYVVDPDPADDAGEAALLVDCATPVAINVEPGSASNPIQLRQDAVPVAVLTTTAGEYGLPVGFDATRIEATTARLGAPGLAVAGAGAPIRHRDGHVEDALERDEVTRDGDDDLVLHFRASETGLVPGGSEVCLRGEYLVPGAPPATFYGCDGVRVVPPTP
ncbi:MAG: hypothetical protein R3263_00570 [Myxococcota bacterium]|nr:hypothetical protein [Myxococcota bacterium]